MSDVKREYTVEELAHVLPAERAEFLSDCTRLWAKQQRLKAEAAEYRALEPRGFNEPQHVHTTGVHNYCPVCVSGRAK